MRYADGPTADAETRIDAPPARVWELVTDIDLPARYSGEFRGADWLDDGPGLGHRFVGRNEHPRFGEWQTTCTVTRFEPQRAFGWVVEDPGDPAATWAYELEPDGTGVRVRYHARLGPGFSGLSIAIASMPDKEERIVARRIEELTANMAATLAGIKATAERRS